MFAAILDGPNNQASCPRDQLDYAFDRCCKASIPQYECETNIQNLLFNGAYNSAVPPFTDSKNPLVVPVFIQYEALEDIEVEEGTATIFITMMLSWIDPRLKWDVENDTCSNVIDVFTGQEQEQTMIWVRTNLRVCLYSFPFLQIRNIGFPIFLKWGFSRFFCRSFFLYLSSVLHY